MRVLLALSFVLCLLVIPTRGYEAVILVHGLAGWGNDEALGIGYWGFKGITDPFGLNPRTDIANLIHLDTGMDVFVASVGPFSSNYDRAVELWSQIKGVRSDYGQSHSTANSHSRFAPVGSSTDYTPANQNGIHHPSAAYTSGNRLTALQLLSGLGTDPSIKVHLIGHSMGCPTIRMFERLMRHGSAAEAGTSNMSPLFSIPSSPNSGTKATTIKSLTCVAGVNSGSALHSRLEQAGSPLSLVSAIKNLLLGVEQLNNFANSPLDTVYDFDLNQFPQLMKIPGESFSQWTDRVFNDPIWLNSYSDLAHWELSPGYMIAEFNTEPGKSLAYSGTKYFSAATFQTEPCDLINAFDPFAGSVLFDQCRDEDMELLLQPTANLMGNLDGVCDSIAPSLCFGNAHERNDALVSVDMQKRPLTSTATETSSENIPQVCASWFWWWCTSYADQWSALPSGSWHWREYEFDHLQVCGLRFSILEWDNPRDSVWKDIVGFLNSVKSNSSPAIVGAQGAAGVATGTVTILLVAAVAALAIKRRGRKASQRGSASVELASPSSSVPLTTTDKAQVLSTGPLDVQVQPLSTQEVAPAASAALAARPLVQEDLLPAGQLPEELMQPPPPGWEVHYEGEFPYFHNQVTGETCWERPQE